VQFDAKMTNVEQQHNKYKKQIEEQHDFEIKEQ
jgi:hypothetical protein